VIQTFETAIGLQLPSPLQALSETVRIISCDLPKTLWFENIHEH